jgi:hypothetical protein
LTGTDHSGDVDHPRHAGRLIAGRRVQFHVAAEQVCDRRFRAGNVGFDHASYTAQVGSQVRRIDRRRGPHGALFEPRPF